MPPLINGFATGIGYGLGLLTVYVGFKLVEWYRSRK